MAVMTVSGEHDSSARPLPCVIGPREELAQMTTELATRMLPLVERIAADVRESWGEWRAAVSRYDSVLAAVDADVDSKLARAAHRDVARRAAELESFRNELTPLGATCDTPRTGRVEWLTLVGGDVATLSWSPGDTRVTLTLSDGTIAEPVPHADEDDPSRS
jgi:Uncharacterized conserved protein (DUF2203)